MKAKMEAYLGGVRGQGLSPKNSPSPRRAEGASGGNWWPPGKRGARMRKAVPAGTARVLNGSLSGGVRGQGLSTAKEDREREGAGMAERRRSIHTGHRQRVKDEFSARGLAGWPDHRVLELLLYYAMPPGGCERAGPRAGGEVRLAGRGCWTPRRRSCAGCPEWGSTPLSCSS